MCILEVGGPIVESLVRTNRNAGWPGYILEAKTTFGSSMIRVKI